MNHSSGTTALGEINYLLISIISFLVVFINYSAITTVIQYHFSIIHFLTYLWLPVNKLQYDKDLKYFCLRLKNPYQRKANGASSLDAYHLLTDNFHAQNYQQKLVIFYTNQLLINKLSPATSSRLRTNKYCLEVHGYYGLTKAKDFIMRLISEWEVSSHLRFPMGS
jgi:hypothetical protein